MFLRFIRSFFVAVFFSLSLILFTTNTAFYSSTLSVSSEWNGVDPFLPGETREATIGISEKIDPPMIQRARKSHTNPQFKDPLMSVVCIVESVDGDSILFLQKEGETRWQLVEQESVLGEDYEESAARALKPMIPIDAVYEITRVGFTSKPNRFSEAYVYAPIVKIKLMKEVKKISPPAGYAQARFINKKMLLEYSFHSAHHSFIAGFLEGGPIGDMENPNEVFEKISDPKGDKTRARHRATIARNLTQPNISLNGVIEMEDDEGNFQGILLTKRGGKVGMEGEWELPGGHPSFDESGPQAFAREIEEEVGIEINVTRELGVRTRRHEQSRFSYWTLFYVARGKGTPKVDGQEVADFALVRTLAEAKAFAASHPFGSDNYTFLVRYFLEREGKNVNGLVTPLPNNDNPALRRFSESSLATIPISENRKSFVLEALSILIPEIAENRKGFLWRYEPEDYRFALESPAHHFLTDRLHDSLVHAIPHHPDGVSLPFGSRWKLSPYGKARVEPHIAPRQFEGKEALLVTLMEAMKFAFREKVSSEHFIPAADLNALAKKLLAELGSLPGHVEVGMEKRVSFELFKIFFVSRLIEILDQQKGTDEIPYPSAQSLPIASSL